MTEIIYEVDPGDRFIIQTYHPNTGTCYFYSFDNLENCFIDKWDIGVWKIKYKTNEVMQRDYNTQTDPKLFYKKPVS